MKKTIFKKITAFTLAAALAITSVNITAKTATAATDSVTNVAYLDGTVTNNASDNNYTVWSSPMYSYLLENDDGTFSRVEYVSGTGVIVETYSASNELQSTKTISTELSIFGGFYAGEDYNYIVFGQSNSNEDDTVEVLRIVKYDKSWNRISACSVYGANTYVPFDAGSARMTEVNGLLYLYTCHTMYASSDGYNHQANMTFVIDESTMSVSRSYYSTMNNSVGYVSHSFNQFIQTDGTYVYRVDHGDAYPRGIYLSRCTAGGSITSVTYGTIYSICGTTGANATGVSIGGFELSTSNCLVAGNSVDMTDSSSYSASAQRNIFVQVTNKAVSSTSTVWLTDYTSDDGITPRTPQLVKISDDKFVVMWEEYASSDKSVTVKAAIIDGSGNVSSTTTLPMRLSDCQPILTSDGYIKWYVTNGSTAVMYTWDPADSSKKTQTITVEDSYELTYGGEALNLNATATAGALSYVSSNTSVATVDKDGNITPVGAGTATITIYAGSTSAYAMAVTTTTVTVNAKSLADGVAYFTTIGTQTYSGYTSNVAVTVDGTKLTYSTDYTRSASTSIYSSDGTYYLKYATLTITGKNNYTDSFKYVIYPITAQSVMTSAAWNEEGNAILIAWQEETGGLGYEIYRATEDGEYELVATIDDRSTTTWTDEDIDATNAYTYAVRAYTLNSDDETIYAELSDGIEVISTAAEYMNTITVDSELTLTFGGESVAIEASALENATFTYSSSDTSIATVDANGVVTPVAAGTATIYVTASKTTSYARTRTEVTVTVDKKSLANGAICFSQVGDIPYTSSAYKNYVVVIVDDEILTLSTDYTLSISSASYSSGYLTSGKITVTGKGNYTGSFSMTVKPITDQTSLNTVIIDADDTAVTLTWTAETGALGYEIYRSVDDGEFELYQTITDRTTDTWADEEISANHTYTYKVRAYTINFDSEYVYAEFSDAFIAKYENAITVESTMTLTYGGDSASLGATNEQNLTFTYTSSNESVAAVDENGVVTPVAVGTAVITITTPETDVYAANTATVTVTVSGKAISTTYPYFTAIGTISFDDYADYIAVADGDTTLTYSTDYTYYLYSKSITDDNDINYVYIRFTGKVNYYTNSYYYYRMYPITAQTVLTSVKWSSDGIVVKWPKETSALGYEIYRSLGDDDYELVATITNRDTVTWTDETADASTGYAYTYKIRAYTKDSDGEVIYAEFSDSQTVEYTNEITVPSTTLTMTYGDDPISIGATDIAGAELTYTLSKTTVATIDENGTITAIGAGTVTITISAAETGVYTSASTTVTLTVSKKSIADGTVYFTKIGAIEQANLSSYFVVELDGLVFTYGTDFYFTGSSSSTSVNSVIYVQSISGTIIGKGNCTGSFAFSVKPISEQMTLNSVTLSEDNASIDVVWTAETGAIGYELYRSINDGEYELVATITDSSTSSWTDEIDSYSEEDTYTYKIRAYTKDNEGEVIYTEFSAEKSLSAEDTSGEDEEDDDSAPSSGTTTSGGGTTTSGGGTTISGSGTTDDGTSSNSGNTSDSGTTTSGSGATNDDTTSNSSTSDYDYWYWYWWYDDGDDTDDTGTYVTGSDGATYLITSATSVAFTEPADSTATSITVPATVTVNGITYKVTTIEASAFAGNTTITSVSIGKNVKNIGANAFSGCTSLTKITGCAAVTTIEANAFKGCKKLISVAGCKKLVTIGDSAFEGCTKLTTIGGTKGVITLPKVKTIGKKAFFKCKSIVKVNATSKKLVSIGDSAFAKCTKLKTFVSKSKKLKTIGKKAFFKDKSLANVTLKTKKLTTKTLGKKAFAKINSTCTFKVPKAKAAAYMELFKAKGAGKDIKVKA